VKHLLLVVNKKIDMSKISDKSFGWIRQNIRML